MNKFLSLASLALVSQMSLANSGLSANNASVLETAQTKTMNCEVAVLDKDQTELSVFKGSMALKDDGETLETPVGNYSVLIQYYVSKTPDEKANERVEISINSENQQEDYINSSAKPIVFLSSLSGLLPAINKEFVGILIDCTPGNR